MVLTNDNPLIFNYHLHEFEFNPGAKRHRFTPELNNELHNELQVRNLQMIDPESSFFLTKILLN